MVNVAQLNYRYHKNYEIGPFLLSIQTDGGACPNFQNATAFYAEAARMGQKSMFAYLPVRQEKDTKSINDSLWQVPRRKIPFVRFRSLLTKRLAMKTSMPRSLLLPTDDGHTISSNPAK